MRNRGDRYVLGYVVLAMLVVHSDLSAQQTAQTPPKTTPRAADGRPDLTGLWVAGNAGNRAPSTDAKGSVQVYLALPGLNPDSPNVFKEMDSVAVKLRAANPNKPVYKPELLSKVKELSDLQAKLDPAFRSCSRRVSLCCCTATRTRFELCPPMEESTVKMWSHRTWATR